MERLDFDPIAAVTSPDPYPAYADCVTHRPLYRDEQRALWIATGAAAVEAALTNPLLRVRPAGELVPATIAGTPLGDVFGGLVRWHDGSSHAALRGAVAATLGALEGSVAELARECARDLGASTFGATGVAPDASRVRTFAFSLPAYTIARLLGLSMNDARTAVAKTRDIVYALLPSANATDLAAGSAAASALRTPFAVLGKDAAIANAIGFLIQGYDATAGLIGNALVALARDPALATNDLAKVVAEVARFDAPVQNTRRFAAAATTLCDVPIARDDAVLVVTGAANRDPEANPEPDRFDLMRTSPRTFTFGLATHACPGARIASAVARAGVEYLMSLQLDLTPWAAPGYEPRTNVRIPMLRFA